jgi:hypothetical protein
VQLGVVVAERLEVDDGAGRGRDDRPQDVVLPRVVQVDLVQHLGGERDVGLAAGGRARGARADRGRGDGEVPRAGAQRAVDEREPGQVGLGLAGSAGG